MIVNRILFWNLRLTYRLWRKINRDCNPRYWSNDELKKLAPLFSGDVINVSAGKDEDKEGGFYHDYFVNSDSYVISNYKKQFGNADLYDEIELDLNIPISLESHLVSRFDVVFSHTVLEHVYDMTTAITNLCSLSKDIVITVVPYIQSFHQDEKYYHDYWRISPYAIIKLFEECDFKAIYISWNNDPIGNIYLFHVASKHPERWSEIVDMQKGYMNRLGPGYYRQLLLSNISNCPAGEIRASNYIVSPLD